MRISDYQRKIILDSAKKLFGDDVQVRLFGSRVDDAKKGGDIDLYVEPKKIMGVLQIAHARRILEDALEIKVDLVVNNGNVRLPIFDIAKRTGVLL